MRINVSIILLLSLLFPLMATAKTVHYQEGKRMQLALSTSNPNFIHIDGDIITKIDFLDKIMSFTGTNSGGAIIVINDSKPFTFFIQTQKGLTIPIQTNAAESQGFYYQILPDAIKANPVVQKWEKPRALETNLVELAKSILNHSTEMIGEQPKGALPKFTIDSLRVTPKEMFVGNKVNVVRYEIKNIAKYPQKINENPFKINGIKALFFNNNNLTIAAKQSLDIYLMLAVE